MRIFIAVNRFSTTRVPESVLAGRRIPSGGLEPTIEENKWAGLIGYESCRHQTAWYQE